MSDLSEIQSSQSVKIAGANPSTGAEDNYLEVDTNGAIATKLTGDTDNTKIGNVSDSLKVNVTNSFAAGTADKGTFTYGTTIENAIGGVYQDTSPTLTAGQQGAVRLTQYRALHTNLRDSSGNEVGVTSAGDLEVSDGLSGGGVYGNLALTTANTTYEVKVGGSRLANRKMITIQATDNDIYWGYDSSVATTTGTLLQKGTFISFSVDPGASTAFQLWLVCASSSKNARITESL